MALIACAAPAKQITPSDGPPAPDFNVETLSGEHLSLTELRGKTVLLVFWSTWCAVCKHELKQLEALYTAHKAENFEVVAISAYDSREALETFLARDFGSEKLSFPIGLDSAGLIREQFQVQGIPLGFLIGPDGRFLSIDEPSGRTYIFSGEKNYLEPGFVKALKKAL